MASAIGSPPQIIRQKSATMKEMPSVTSTCAICWPGNWRSRKRSITIPNTATSAAANSAATQKLNMVPSMPPAKVAPKYAPSMNSDPCVRFGMRISPKISEKPAANRNNRPPKVMLLTVSSSQKVIRPIPAGRRCSGHPGARRRREPEIQVDARLLMSGFRVRSLALRNERQLDPRTPPARRPRRPFSAQHFFSAG